MTPERTELVNEMIDEKIAEIAYETNSTEVLVITVHDGIKLGIHYNGKDLIDAGQLISVAMKKIINILKHTEN